MFRRILKKDLRRKRGVNLILLAFMILCSLFSGSSAANVVTTHNATRYFMELSRVADQYYFALSHFDDEFDSWLQSCPYAENYEKSVHLRPGREDVTINGQVLNPGAASLAFTTAGGSYSLMFDEDGRVVSHVASGEMAMSAERAGRLGLHKGDILEISGGGGIRNLRLTTLTRDAVYGKEAMDLVRIFISDQDYAALATDNPNTITVWSVQTSDPDSLRMDYNRKNVPTAMDWTQNAVRTLFFTEQIFSFIYIAVAAVMIMIALVLLRFAIRFSLEEDYREIGVMKAIGIKNASVREVYVVKYLAISLTGAAIGLALSFPFSDLLLASLKESIIMPTAVSGPSLLTRILCSLAVVALTMLLSWKTTGQVVRMSAAQAMRDGASGESFRSERIIRLRGSRMKPVLFMAVSDVLKEWRSYVSVFLALIFTMLIIILPANIASTLRSGESLAYCGWSRADAYADAPDSLISAQGRTWSELKAVLTDIEREFAGQGIGIEADALIVMSPRVCKYKEDKAGAISVTGFKRLTSRPADIPCYSGDVPRVANEIAMTDVLMKKLNVYLGDTVVLSFGPKEKKYIVTGRMQSMGNDGNVIIFASADEPESHYISSTFAVLINFTGRTDIPGQIARAKEAFPQYNISDSAEKLRSILGGTIDMMNAIVLFLFLISLMMICLVVYLISHTFLVRDRSAIAFLKAVGFTNGLIRSWQTLRMLIVSTVAVLFGTGLSFLITPLVIKMTFGLAGADRIPPQYDVLWTFIIYPVLMLAGVTGATLLACLGICRISLGDISRFDN